MDDQYPVQQFAADCAGTCATGLSYRDVEELLAERGIEVDHVTVFRWVPPFTPLLIDAARPCRRSRGIGGSPMTGDVEFTDSTLSQYALRCGSCRWRG